MKTFLTALIFSVLATQVCAEAPGVGKPLPVLSIDDRGELLLKDEKFSYRPWNYKSRHNEVHILQYFAGTQSDSETFKSLTDLLKGTFPDGGYHVTTLINLDASMWGTSGLVASKAKSSKKEFPDSTLVLDEEGAGHEAWALGKKSAMLAIMSKSGDVIYITHEALSEQELTQTLALISGAIDS